MKWAIATLVNNVSRPLTAMIEKNLVRQVKFALVDTCLIVISAQIPEHGRHPSGKRLPHSISCITPDDAAAIAQIT